jgi:hypothetical protein
MQCSSRENLLVQIEEPPPDLLWAKVEREAHG